MEFADAIVDLRDCHSRYAKLGDVTGQWEAYIWLAEALAGLGSVDDASQLLLNLEKEAGECGCKLFVRLAREKLQNLLGDENVNNAGTATTS